MNIRRHAIVAPCALIILTAVAFGQTGIITTVAGNGTGSYSGDGGPAGSATINNPTGVAVDSRGNLYIADYLNNSIRKVDTAGNINTVAGCGPSIECLIAGPGDGGPATHGSVMGPFDVVVDGNGNIYASDSGRNSVRKVDQGGTITTFAGGKGAGFSGDGGPAAEALLNDPVGLAVDGSGNLYIADLVNNRIRKVDTSGTITTVAGNGQLGYSGDGGSALAASFNNPHDVAVDGDGNLYIADTNNFVVRKVDKAGIVTTVAGNGTVTENVNGSGPATSVAIVSPWGLAIDKEGNLFIAEFLGYKVRKMDRSGNVVTVAGSGNLGYSGDGGPATSANLWALVGVAVDGAGTIYIGDNLNNRVRKVTQPRAAPSVNDLGIVNNASFAAGSNPLAPGTIAAVFGANLNDGSSVYASSFGSDGKLVTTLGGAQVKINGTPVPIFYSTPSQLGVQIPTELAAGNATVEVVTGGQTSAAKTITIAANAPGIFSVNQSGTGQGAVLIANTDTLVAPVGSISGRDARPAKVGDFITIFCTGLGAVSPALASGVPAASNTTTIPPGVTIDGLSALVQFSGMAPGFVGLNQVNVQVPPGTRAGDAIPVALTIGGKQSNTVTIAVSAQ
jgi:uncharacterized protein (TIGR03437 family)